jgi:hypothetical protein
MNTSRRWPGFGGVLRGLDTAPTVENGHLQGCLIASDGPGRPALIFLCDFFVIVMSVTYSALPNEPPGAWFLEY